MTIVEITGGMLRAARASAICRLHYPSFGLPELLAAIHTSRQSCSKAGKARIFALVWESSGESRFMAHHAGCRRARGKNAGQMPQHFLMALSLNRESRS